MDKDFKPRARDLVLGGIPWIARMADKARAKADGTIGDYIYPCPIDVRVLGELGISADGFVEIATASATDAELLGRVQQARSQPE